jgi:hypothetical protein
MRLLFFKLTLLYKRALRSLRDQVVFRLVLWVPLVAHPFRLQGWVLPLDFKAVCRNLWSEVLA